VNEVVSTDGSMTFTVCASRLVLALSDALDLVGVDLVQHGKRVAFLSLQVARELGWTERRTHTLCLAALLHDFGVSSTEVHRRLLASFAWEGSHSHCERGYDLLRGVTTFSALAEPIRYHHTPWPVFDLEHVGRETALLANTIFLSDRVDALLRRSGLLDGMVAGQRCADVIRRNGPSFFAAELVEAFTRVARRPATWYTLEPHHLQRALDAVLAPLDEARVGFDELRNIAEIFAGVVDYKSRFTQEHSRGVASLASLLGRLEGLATRDSQLLEVAGLLHDIGKLRLPDAILDKPGRLSRSEAAAVTRHPFETHAILSRVSCLPELAPWASQHHETLKGDGYPFRLAGDAISTPARIVAVADVTQALVQDRPYRSALPERRVLEALRRMARLGRLDGAIVDLVAKNREECLHVARGAAAA
jgi:HD-GYP domain-containing protein (c-di-GMP phosphodiesterase class II)